MYLALCENAGTSLSKLLKCLSKLGLDCLRLGADSNNVRFKQV